MNTVKAEEICKLCNLVFINEKMCKKHKKGDFHSRVQQVILSTPSQSSFILPPSVSIPVSLFLFRPITSKPILDPIRNNKIIWEHASAQKKWIGNLYL